MTQPVTLITGASAGLGVDFARQYAAKGHRLVLVARRQERLEELAAELGNARAVALDLSTDKAADALMADLAAHGEHCELLINNAGFGLVGQIVDLDRAQQRQMIDLNCGALTELAHAALPGMIERKLGGILNVASVASFQPGPGMAVYFATKAYVLSFSEALHEEAKPHGVHVSALCPGPTSTEFGEVAGFGGNKAVDTLAAQPGPVVTAGIEGLAANKAVVVPGLSNKISAQANRFLPRSTIRKIVGMIKK
ncbi:SDR family NAD(P)-dependent oxidoreductase [Sphingomicrobium flavum]|uniref:SDR family NAD(P)-dependent oxidoreductase n=1 Tax=Sphingomicrobium flavum TaxID=1229164 RepID=UPI0021AD588A|nr:SDR family oxidoreductase [Sphingomicrobium flavum]